MGLLIAFIFAGAAVRFDNRRMVIAQEANAIETAYLRLATGVATRTASGLSDVSPRPACRNSRYTEHEGCNRGSREVTDLAAQNMEGRGWGNQGKRHGNTDADVVCNERDDRYSTVRTAGMITHLPFLVLALLLITILLSSFLTGCSISAYGTRDWLSAIIFAIAVSCATYVTLDYEYPRVGLICCCRSNVDSSFGKDGKTWHRKLKITA